MNFLALVPWYYRWAALLVMIAAVWCHGWFTAHSSDEHLMALKDAKLQAITDQAKANAVEERARQAQARKRTMEEFENETDAIHDFYVANPVERVRRLVVRTGCPAAPAPAIGTGGADAPAAESVATRRNQGFEKACALDAAQVNALQQFLIRNGFPME